MDGFTETPLQHHIGEGVPFGGRLSRSHLGTMADGIAQLTQPLQRGLLNMGFVQGHGLIVIDLVSGRNRVQSVQANNRPMVPES